jgi:hypothetical protein
MSSTRKYRGDALSEKDIDQDTAPRDISVLTQGRYPGSQDLAYRLPMNWRIHSDITEPRPSHVRTCLVRDTPTPAHRCGGSPGIEEALIRPTRSVELVQSFQPGSRLTRP